jgi:hypothetical protein
MKFWLTYNSDPFLESADKSNLGNLHALFATATAAEQVVAWAEETPAATGALLFFDRDVDLVKKVRVV